MPCRLAYRPISMQQCSRITISERSNDQPAWRIKISTVVGFTVSVLQLSGPVHTGDNIDCRFCRLDYYYSTLMYKNRGKTARQWNSTTVKHIVEPTVTVSTVISIPNRGPVRCLVTSFLWILKSFLASDVRKLSLCLLFRNVK